MKALELADSVEKNWSTGYREQIVSELRRLAAVEADCAPYLKDGETPAERINRALGDADSLMNLYRDVVAERDALKAENALLEEVNAQLREQNDAVGKACAKYEAELERFKDAYDAWQEKTEWVQTTAAAGELGKHRADVLRERIEKLKSALSAAPAAQPEPVMIYHGRCTIDCGEHGHQDVEMLKMIQAGTKLYALGSKTHE